MFTAREDTTLVGVSELRTKFDKILEKTKNGTVIIEKRNKAKAVLISNEEYERIMNLLETAEDFVLGYIASERLKNSKESDFVDIENLF